MTTFAFANVQASFSGGTSLQHGEQTIYTVPTGKLAKIKFDSYHISVSSTSNTINNTYWALYSQDSSTTAARKHMYGESNFGGGESGMRTFSFYNPSDFKAFEAQYGGQYLHSGKLMSASPENFIYNNVVQDFNDSSRGATYTDNTQGTYVYGPETFFMAAGEVLKLRTKSACNGSLTRYTNMRCAIWLEDV